jgi:hypothetical protein
MKKAAPALLLAVLMALTAACGGDGEDASSTKTGKGVVESIANAIAMPDGGLLDDKQATCVAKKFVDARGLDALHKSKAVGADDEYVPNGALNNPENAEAYSKALFSCVDEDDALASIAKSAEASYGAQTQGILKPADVHCLMTSFVEKADPDKLFTSKFLKDTGEFDGTGASYDKDTATAFASALTACVDYPALQAQDAAAKDKKVSVSKMAACLRKAIPNDDLTATIVARLTSDPDSDKLIEASNAKAVACEKTSRK